MTATPEIDLGTIHKSVETWGLTYPEGPLFAELRPLTLEESRIPKSRYFSPEEHARELEFVWYRTWQMACREEEVAKPGDYLEYVIGTQSFIVARGDDGVLRAFHNVCKHRGNLLVEGAGNVPNFTCSYHAWCWKTTGELENIPDMHLVRGIDNSYNMSEVGCDVFGGWVFIHPRPDEMQPLTEFLGPLVEQLNPYHVDRMRPNMHVVMELEANWKTALEAFLETYHLIETHPQIMTYVDDINTKYETLGDHDRMIVPFGIPTPKLDGITQEEIFKEFYKPRPSKGFVGGAVLELPKEAFDANGNWIYPGPVREFIINRQIEVGKELGHDYSELSRGQLVDDYDYHVFPGMKFNQHAGAVLAFRSRPHATDPEKCYFDVWTALWGDEHAEALPEPAAVEVKDLKVDSLGLLLDQDFANIPKVQKGLHSNNLEFLTLMDSELRIAHFHQVLQKYIAVGQSQS